MAHKPFSSQVYEKARLRKLSAHTIGNRILDIGYAQMPNPYILKNGRHITGIDLLPPPENKPYDLCIQGDVFKLRELDGGCRYDCIIAGEFIEHIERPYDLLRTLRTSIKAGGRLVLSTPNPAGFPVLFWEWAVSRKRFYALDHSFYFSPRWMARLINNSGYNLESILGVGLWPTLFPVPAGLSYQVIYTATPKK